MQVLRCANTFVRLLYFETVNRGKVIRPSSALNFLTQSAFAALELTEIIILASSAPEKVLTKFVLD